MVTVDPGSLAPSSVSWWCTQVSVHAGGSHTYWLVCKQWNTLHGMLLIASWWLPSWAVIVANNFLAKVVNGQPVLPAMRSFMRKWGMLHTSSVLP